MIQAFVTHASVAVAIPAGKGVAADLSAIAHKGHHSFTLLPCHGQAEEFSAAPACGDSGSLQLVCSVTDEGSYHSAGGYGRGSEMGSAGRQSGACKPWLLLNVQSWPLRLSLIQFMDWSSR